MENNEVKFVATEINVADAFQICVFICFLFTKSLQKRANLLAVEILFKTLNLWKWKRFCLMPLA